METNKKILIGGQALRQYGSTRFTNDTDYLTYIDGNNAAFAFDAENNIDYCNANGNEFFAKIYELEKNNDIASPQSILELKVYSWAMHWRNRNVSKLYTTEFDIAFLLKNYNLKAAPIAMNYLNLQEKSELKKLFNL